MTNLNLLPNATKRQIIKTIHYIQIVNNIIFLAIILTVISIILFANKSYLNFKMNKLSNITAVSEENKKISSINNTIQQINLVQQDYVKWSKILVDFFNLIPAGNQIQSLTFDKNKKILLLNGHANNRKAFLKLKNNLENFDLITKINSPISNLLHQTDFNFTLSAELKL